MLILGSGGSGYCFLSDDLLDIGLEESKLNGCCFSVMCAMSLMTIASSRSIIFPS